MLYLYFILILPNFINYFLTLINIYSYFSLLVSCTSANKYALSSHFFRQNKIVLIVCFLFAINLLFVILKLPKKVACIALFWILPSYLFLNLWQFSGNLTFAHFSYSIETTNVKATSNLLMITPKESFIVLGILLWHSPCFEITHTFLDSFI